MPTVVLDPLPAEIAALLERRRRWGADTHDEVWDGVLHMTPAPSHAHAVLNAALTALLREPAAAAGLAVTDAFNLGDSKEDFRVPDGGLHRPGAAEMWHPTAALAVEVVSPGDETWQKLPFYAAHHVDEVLIVDPQQRKADWLALDDGQYRPIERSGLIDLGPAELAGQIDWP
jgi:Uma2 family endonuclease